MLTEVGKGDAEKVVALLTGADCGAVDVNCLDSHGMTPLMHAAHKGSHELCELLIQVNSMIRWMLKKMILLITNKLKHQIRPKGG
jgi:ankyrin repeat protein